LKHITKKVRTFQKYLFKICLTQLNTPTCESQKKPSNKASVRFSNRKKSKWHGSRRSSSPRATVLKTEAPDALSETKSFWEIDGKRRKDYILTEMDSACLISAGHSCYRCFERIILY